MMKNYFIIAIAVVIALASSSIAKDPAQEFREGNRTTFSTQNHPKSKGVNFKIEYPNSWVAKEGERPNVVQKFISEGGSGLEMVIIMTRSLPVPADNTISKADLEELFTPSEMKDMLPEGAKFIHASQTKIEGLPAGILEYSMRGERAGIVMETQTISYIFIHRSTMVNLMCQVGGKAASQIEISNRMTAFKPLFALIANSIVIPDLWTAEPEVSTNGSIVTSSSHPYEETLPTYLTIIISFIITWGLGLAPSLLIRYVFMRRPLEKKTAAYIAAVSSAFFWIVFRVIRSVLEEPTGSGAVWIIIFFISQWIMSRGYVPTKLDSEVTSQSIFNDSPPPPIPSIRMPPALPTQQKEPKKDRQIDESHTFMGGRQHPWRRYFAKFIDINILGLSAFFVVMLAVGYIAPEQLEGLLKAAENNITASVIIVGLWIPIEASLLSVFGNTPGRWLYGISIRSISTEKLSFGTAFKRAVKVAIQGMGGGIPLVAFFTQYYAYRRLTKTGTTLWDSSVGSVVTHVEWGPVRPILCTIVTIAVVFVIALLTVAGNNS